MQRIIQLKLISHLDLLLISGGKGENPEQKPKPPTPNVSVNTTPAGNTAINTTIPVNNNFSVGPTVYIDPKNEFIGGGFSAKYQFG